MIGRYSPQEVDDGILSDLNVECKIDSLVDAYESAVRLNPDFDVNRYRLSCEACLNDLEGSAKEGNPFYDSFKGCLRGEYDKDKELGLFRAVLERNCLVSQIFIDDDIESESKRDLVREVIGFEQSYFHNNSREIGFMYLPSSYFCC